jgi:predicted transcriptional regulator
MQTEIPKKTPSKNMTVKLEDSERERIKSLSVVLKRSPHYIMREAIRNYLDEEEAEQRFIAVAKQSLEEFKKTGEHITLEEFSGWVKAKKNNPNAAMPLCHK